MFGAGLPNHTEKPTPGLFLETTRKSLQALKKPSKQSLVFKTTQQWLAERVDLSNTEIASCRGKVILSMATIFDMSLDGCVCMCKRAHIWQVFANTCHSKKMSNTQRNVPVDISCNLQLTIRTGVCKSEGRCVYVCVCVCMQVRVCIFVSVCQILSLWSHLYSSCVQKRDIFISQSCAFSKRGWLLPLLFQSLRDWTMNL